MTSAFLTNRLSATLISVLATVFLIDGQSSKAMLVYHFGQSGNDVILTMAGSFSDLGSPVGGDFNTLVSPFVSPTYANVASGPLPGQVATYRAYGIVGPSAIGDGTGSFPASASGVATQIGSGLLYLPATYTVGGFISAKATFVNATFASIGLSDTTTTFDWTLTGTGEIVRVQLGGPAPLIPSESPSVPAPLPLFGAATAFGVSRRLRGRIQSARSPQAFNLPRV